MFAKLSPTGHEAAYVHERNIYLESLRDGSVKKLTETPSEHIINGITWPIGNSTLKASSVFRWSITPIRSTPKSPGSLTPKPASKTPPAGQA
jgi:hypothetical protein